jgi:diguanylate cyclase (GGDEF)-like protein/PAS domain S-box-containing protein
MDLACSNPDRDKPSLDRLLDLLLDAVCMVDRNGRFVYVNAAITEILGYTPQELIGRPIADFMHPDDRERTLHSAARVMQGEEQRHFENRYVHRDGHAVDLMWSARWSEDARLRIGVARDVTALKRAQRVQSALYAISEAAHAAADLPALCRQLQLILSGLLPAARLCLALRLDDGSYEFPYHSGPEGPAGTQMPPCTAKELEQVIAAATPTRMQHEGLAWLVVPLRAGAQALGVLAVAGESERSTYSDADSALLGFVSDQVGTLIERKQAETRLLHMARHDPLTDLPNRTLFEERLHSALAAAARSGSGVAVLYLDLDRFKQINDRYGHASGDRLLCEVAQRLQGAVRGSDTVARMGGDEFVLLLNGIGSAAGAEAVAEKLRTLLEQPFTALGRPECIAPSIGIALYPEHAQTAETLIARADAAMYAAKLAGGNRAAVAAASAETLDS